MYLNIVQFLKKYEQIWYMSIVTGRRCSFFKEGVIIMFKKVPVIAACLIMACGIEAWGAEVPSARTSRSAVMQSPARDGAYVLELPAW